MEYISSALFIWSMLLLPVLFPITLSLVLLFSYKRQIKEKIRYLLSASIAGYLSAWLGSNILIYSLTLILGPQASFVEENPSVYVALFFGPVLIFGTLGISAVTRYFIQRTAKGTGLK